MTDTTKPTGDTIDDVDKYATEMVMTLMLGTIRKASYQDIDIPMARKLGRAFMDGLAKEGIVLLRLAERPNRAVARGDSVTISRQDAVFAVNQLRQLSRNERGLMYTDFLADRIEIAIALTTPTETTDPAMEGE